MQEALKSKGSNRKIPISLTAAGIAFCLLVFGALASLFLMQNNHKSTTSSLSTFQSRTDKSPGSFVTKGSERLGRFSKNNVKAKLPSLDSTPLNSSEQTKLHEAAAITSSKTATVPSKQGRIYQGLYPLDLADLETREEMLTDPEVLKRTDSDNPQ